MPKIRKQPKRSTKKLRIPSFRNPFQKSQPYLPLPIANNLKSLDQIILRHIDDLICEPEETSTKNLSMMKEALAQQQLKLKGLKM